MRHGAWLALSGVLLWVAAAARAVINLETTLEKTWAAADPILVGKVAGVEVERRLVEVEVVEAAKGTAPDGRVRVQIPQPPELLAAVKTGQPAVVFVNPRRPMAVVHLADTWLLAGRVGDVQPAAWRVVQEHDLKRTFPGPTRTLVRLLGELKAGRSPLLNMVDDRVFTGEVRRLGGIRADGASAMLTADFDGDGRPDVAAGGPGGVRVYVSEGGRYAAAGDGWHLPAGPPLAAGDVNGDGRIDVLAGAVVALNTGSGFRAAAVEGLPGDLVPLAGALVDVDGDGRIDAAVLGRDGRLAVLRSADGGAKWTAGKVLRLWKDTAPAVHAALGDFGDDGRPCAMVLHEDGPVRYALSENDPPADFTRLTGERLSAYDRNERGFRDAVAAAADVTGDGRSDYLIVTREFALLLLNRGGGAFFASAQGAHHLCAGAAKEKGAAVSKGDIIAPVAGTAAKRDGLLVLSADGMLRELTNPVPPEQGH